jgi:uncharacterized membrane protein YeaQ/YmgE (transglycosylase-associated protein family)
MAVPLGGAIQCSQSEDLMGILAWIVFGLIAGALARWLTPGRGPSGCLTTIAIGIAGSVIDGFIGTQLGFGTVNGFDIRSFIIAILGSALLLTAFRMLGNGQSCFRYGTSAILNDQGPPLAWA